MADPDRIEVKVSLRGGIPKLLEIIDASNPSREEIKYFSDSEREALSVGAETVNLVLRGSSTYKRIVDSIHASHTEVKRWLVYKKQ